MGMVKTGAWRAIARYSQMAYALARANDVKWRR